MSRKLQSIVVVGQPVFIGLEIAKKTWVICARSNKMVVHETSMPGNYANLSAYLASHFPDCDISLIYEAGFSGFGLYDKLVAEGRKCVVTPPHTVTLEKHRPIKNDRVDSRRLATVLESGDFKECNIPDKVLREDRTLIRRYTQIQDDIIREKNRLRRLLEFSGYDPYPNKACWEDKQYLSIPEHLDSIPEITPSFKYSAKNIVSQIVNLRKEKCLILKMLRALGQSERYKRAVELYCSVPGIGSLTAIRLALEWGDLARFSTKAKFAHFIGLTPFEFSSGESDHKGHITKQGNRRIRAALIETSWIIRRKDPVMSQYYNALFGRTGCGKKAIVAVARKLAMRLRALILTDKPYQIGVLE